MKKLMTYAITGLVILSAVYSVGSIILYGQIILPFLLLNEEEIARKAIWLEKITGRQYIICKWERITGYNYELVQNEDGDRTNAFCRVSGIKLEEEFTYEFMISGNSFVFYVTEKKQYYDSDLAEVVTEYVVDGWDVLYPVKRQALFNTAPKFILKGELKK